MKTKAPNIVKYVGNKRVNYNEGTRVSLRLDKLDARTKIGQTAQLLYDCLWDYIGEATAPAIILIDTIVFKKMKLILCESSQLEQPAEKLPQMYLSISNSLRSDLQLLAQFAQKAAPPNLDDYLKETHGKKRK